MHLLVLHGRGLLIETGKGGFGFIPPLNASPELRKMEGREEKSTVAEKLSEDIAAITSRYLQGQDKNGSREGKKSYSLTRGELNLRSLATVSLGLSVYSETLRWQWRPSQKESSEGRRHRIPCSSPTLKGTQAS